MSLPTSPRARWCRRWRDGTPLSALDEFADRPHAYVKLWRHHAAQPQADRINALAAERGETWLPRYGGLISSEWEFAKGLELLEGDREIYDRMEHWVEAADWIVWQLTGSYVRNACTVGYKAIYQDGAYPDRDFLAALNPDFADFVEAKLSADDRPARLGRRHAERRGGAVDGAPGGDRGGGGQRRRPRHRTGRAGGGTGADAGHHGYLDLSRHELGPGGRGARDVRRRRRRHHGRALGVRGRAVRGGRHLRLVRARTRCRARSTPRPSRPARRCTST